MATVSSYGNVEGIIKNVLMSNGATQKAPNGRFFIDGQMIDVELSRAIAEAIYLYEIYQPGLNCTAKYTDDTKPGGAVRVPTEQPFAPSSRTLSYGGRQGTPGNGGIFNANEPVLPTTDEFLIYMNQINDQDLVFPDVAKAFIPLDLMAGRIASYGRSVAQDRTASTTAEVLLYNIFRAMNGASNIIDNFDKSQKNAYSQLIAQINAQFANGDPITGALTYPMEGRCVICKPSFGYSIFNGDQSGIILNGSNLAQEMLRDYDLSKNLSERRYVSDGYLGEFGKMHFVVMPDELWHMAERYMGLQRGALDQVVAVALSADSLALGRAVDLGVKLQDTTYPYPRGVMARPINLWGHEMFRKAIIIAEGEFTTDNLVSLGFNATDRIYPIAPADFKNNNGYKPITVPVYNSNGDIIGYKEVAQGQEPSGDNWQSGVAQVANVVASVKGGTYKSAQSVELTCTTDGVTIYYTTDGSTPTSASNTYSSAISVAKSETIKAIAIKNGLVPSQVMVETFVINA